ncbi:MAG: hypothetical protein QNJ34_03685 [Xenococcaceae cyanobacterium MO_188.B29]|nr:hypothetical protein [Xenococcaceae cyanobacterium MO_188.B29]
MLLVKRASRSHRLIKWLSSLGWRGRIAPEMTFNLHPMAAQATAAIALLAVTSEPHNCTTGMVE